MLAFGKFIIEKVRYCILQPAQNGTVGSKHCTICEEEMCQPRNASELIWFQNTHGILRI